MKTFRISAFLFLLCASATQAADFHSPRTMALGGAGHAGPMLNDSIYLNPSFVSFMPTYSISGNFLSFNGGDKSPEGYSSLHGRHVNISIQDGRSELFQAGLGFTRGDNRSVLNVGASHAVVQRVGVGLGAKMVFPFDGSHARINEALFSTSFIANRWLQTVLIVDNLLESETGRQYGLYREFVLGTKMNFMGAMLVYFDPHYVPALDPGGYGHEIGLEFTPFSDIFVRFGNFRNAAVPFLDGRRGDGWGFGLGWIGPRLSLDFGLSRLIQPVAHTATTFGATVYF